MNTKRYIEFINWSRIIVDLLEDKDKDKNWYVIEIITKKWEVLLRSNMMEWQTMNKVLEFLVNPEDIKRQINPNWY